MSDCWQSSPATTAAEQLLAALSHYADWHALAETGHHGVCHGIWLLTGTHTHLPGENLAGMLFSLHSGACRVTTAIAGASSSVHPSGNNKVFKNRS